MQISLEGKRAFVSGSSSGIGRQCAIDLAKAGCAVVVHGRDPERTEETAEVIRALGGNAFATIGDLATDEGADAVASGALSAFGRIDICVNNCGVSLRQDNPSWDALPISEWIDSLQVNFLSALRMSQAFYPGMKAAGSGRIIHISTLGSEMPGLLSDYTTAKSALNKLTLDMAKQSGPSGITVNAILPGTIMTSAIEKYLGVLNDQLGWNADDLAERQKRYVADVFPQPIGRLGIPEDIAALTVFLASDLAGYITGSLIKCDGGLSPSI